MLELSYQVLLIPYLGSGAEPQSHMLLSVPVRKVKVHAQYYFVITVYLMAALIDYALLQVRCTMQLKFYKALKKLSSAWENWPFHPPCIHPSQPHWFMLQEGAPFPCVAHMSSWAFEIKVADDCKKADVCFFSLDLKIPVTLKQQSQKSYQL